MACTELSQQDLGINQCYPTTGGCYAVYLDGQLSYVGCAQNLRARLSTYRFREGYGGGWFTPWGQCRSVRVKVRSSHRFGDWAMHEIRLIRRLRPMLNCLGLGRQKPELVA